MRTLRLSLASLCFGGALVAQDAHGVPVIICFKDTVSAPLLAEHGVKVQKTLFGTESVTARVPARLVAQLRRRAEIAYVELDHVASAYGPGNGGGGGPGGGGPGGGNGGGGGGGGGGGQTTPPGITRVGGAVAVGNVTVAILDSGIDLDHPDLVANITGSVNYVNNKTADDDNGHGSHCAGTVAASNNTTGVVGVAHNASLLAVKVLDRRGSGSYSDIVSGINWSASNGADILSMSLGGAFSSAAMQSACSSAAGASLLVAAAGNDGDCNLSTDEINYPAYYGSVVSVGATTTDPASMDALMCFSSSNADLELSAPGHDVDSCWKGGGYKVISGTSMACPHVAGCAAVLWNGSPSSVLSTLVSYADDAGPTGRDNGWGWGVAEHVN